MSTPRTGYRDYLADILARPPYSAKALRVIVAATALFAAADIAVLILGAPVPWSFALCLATFALVIAVDPKRIESNVHLAFYLMLVPLNSVVCIAAVMLDKTR
jgi:hypothetical protein